MRQPIAGPDARGTPGYKGFVDKVRVRAANAAESRQFETMIMSAHARRVMADKACAGEANRAALKDRNYRDCIPRKAAGGRPLRASEKRFSKLTSKTPFPC